MRSKRVRVACGILVALITILSLSQVDFVRLHRKIELYWTGRLNLDGRVIFPNPKDKFTKSAFLFCGCYEPAFTRLFERIVHPGQTVVDVGASIGWYTTLAAKIVGPKGRVIAFEPEPTSFGLMKKAVVANGYSQVILEQKALSNSAGHVNLFLASRDLGMHNIFHGEEGQQSIEVESLRFDDYIKLQGGDVDVIKIDAEGAEGVIIEGMEDTLRSNSSVVLFLEFFPRLLLQAGYEPSRLLSVLQKLEFQFFDVGDSYDLSNLQEPQAVLPETLLRYAGSNPHYRTNIVVTRRGF